MTWHPGELEAQKRAGTLELARQRAGNIRPALSDQQRQFFANLPFVALGSVAADGLPWATLVQGPPGFAHAPDDRTLRLDALPPATELAVGEPVGLLGLDFETRRRNRVNGRLTAVGPDGLTVAIEQCFGNCPKYIQARTWRNAGPAVVAPFAGLDGEAGRVLADADTCFVATVGAGGADVSHRGGRPGFLAVEGDAVVVPDYAGNGYFNTLGNLVETPRAGLLVPDFARGDLLQLAGDAEISWGEQRAWRLRPRAGRWLRGAFRPVAGAPDFSPHCP